MTSTRTIPLSLDSALNDKDKEVIQMLITTEGNVDETEMEETIKSSISKRDIRQLSKVARLQLRDFMRRHNIHVDYGMGIQILPALLTEFPDADADASDESIVPHPQPASPRVDITELVNLLRSTTSGIPQQAQSPAAPQQAVPAQEGNPPSSPQQGQEPPLPETSRQAVASTPRVAINAVTGETPVHSYRTMPQLPTTREQNTRSQAGALLKAFAHPSQQFSGRDQKRENLASFHQAFVSTCRTLELTDKEAVQNLHVLFVPDSPASIFYHKYVERKATTLDECFDILYRHFTSEERRDRLVREWNSLNYSVFLKKEGSTPHSALTDLCQTAASLQLQLGEEYQPDTLLRDAILRAVSKQPFARFLA